MSQLFSSSAVKADTASVSPDVRLKLERASAVQKMTEQGLFNGAVRLKSEQQIRSSNGKQSILAGPALEAMDVRPVEAKKAAPTGLLHAKVQPLANALPPHSAALLSLIVANYEMGHFEPVVFRAAEVAKHYDIHDDAAERAIGVLVGNGLIVRVFDGMGAPSGWRPVLPA